jgi:uncharacterized protein (TIGR00290 family)
MKKKIILASSGGKDSLLAFSALQKDARYEMIALLTTITKNYNRISMHGVRTYFLERQAGALGIPLEKIYIRKNITNAEYRALMRDILIGYKNSGIMGVAFGDIFLGEVKNYRKKSLASIGMRAIFPLWKKNTLSLAHTFIDSGFKAIVTCVDSQALDRKFVGRAFDKQFLLELPLTVDPCGENGEFHTFVFDGPIFRESVPYRKGEIILRDNRFYYCDLKK